MLSFSLIHSHSKPLRAINEEIFKTEKISSFRNNFKNKMIGKHLPYVQKKKNRMYLGIITSQNVNLSQISIGFYKQQLMEEP